MRTLCLAIMVSIAAVPQVLAQQDLGEAFLFENEETGASMPYRLFSPPGSDDPGGEFPLVLFLHGAGERGTDNESQVKIHIGGLIESTQSGSYPAFLLAPQVPDTGSWYADGNIDLASDILDSLTESLPIDQDRIYVTGLSMGGFGSLNYIAQFPDRFAAAVPMSGGYGRGAAPLIKDIPIWLFHGDRDTTSIDTNGSREMYNAISEAGGSPYLTEIATGGHIIWEPIYSDASEQRYGLYEWLFSQSRDQPQVPRTLLDFDDSWSFVGDGSDQGTAWRETTYDDSGWSRGSAPLGFGYGDEATELSCGLDVDCEQKHATFYFRHEFDVENPEQFANVMAEFVRDDGMVVYLNGDEIFRDKSFRSEIDFQSFTRSYSANHGVVSLRIDDHLVTGSNTIAVELHQANSRLDTFDDLRLAARVTGWQVPEPTAWMLLLLGCCSLVHFDKRRRPAPNRCQ